MKTEILEKVKKEVESVCLSLTIRTKKPNIASEQEVTSRLHKTDTVQYPTVYSRGRVDHMCAGRSNPTKPDVILESSKTSTNSWYATVEIMGKKYEFLIDSVWCKQECAQQRDL